VVPKDKQFLPFEWVNKVQYIACVEFYQSVGLFAPTGEVSARMHKRGYGLFPHPNENERSQ